MRGIDQQSVIRRHLLPKQLRYLLEKSVKSPLPSRA